MRFIKSLGFLILFYFTPLPTLVLFMILAFRNPDETKELFNEIRGYWNEMIQLYDLEYLNTLIMLLNICGLILFIVICMKMLKGIINRRIFEKQ